MFITNPTVFRNNVSHKINEIICDDKYSLNLEKEYSIIQLKKLMIEKL